MVCGYVLLRLSELVKACRRIQLDTDIDASLGVSDYSARYHAAGSD